MAKANATRIGAFVLGGLALVVAGVLALGSGAWWQPSTKRSVVFGESVQGLQVGAPITYNGVPVGEVSAIGAKLALEDRAIVNGVLLNLRRGGIVVAEGDAIVDAPIESIVDDFVADGLRAQLAIQSFVTGQLYVRLVFDPDTAPYPAPATFMDAPTLPAVPSEMARFGRVAQSIGGDLPEVVARVAELTDRVAALLDETNRDNLAKTLGNFAAFSAALAGAGPEVGETVSGARSVVGTLDGAAQEMASVARSLDETVAENRDAVRVTMERLESAATAAAAAAGQLEELVRENRRAVRAFTNEGLAEVRAFAVQGQTTARTIDRIARRIDSEGANFLFGGETLREYQPRSNR